MRNVFNTLERICFTADFGWFIDVNYQLLYRIDKVTGEYVCETELPISEGNVYQYRKLVSYNDCLVLVPYNASKILIYNTKEKTFCKVELDLTYSSNNMRMIFEDACVVGNTVVFVPARYNSIVLMNMDDYSLKYVVAPIARIISDHSFLNNRHIFNCCLTLDTSSFLAPYWQNGTVLKMNIETNQIEYINICPNESGIGAICFHDGIITVGIKDKMVIYEYDEMGNVNKFDLLDKGEDGKEGIRSITFIGTEYIVIPFWKEKIFSWNHDFSEKEALYEIDAKNPKCQKYAYADFSFFGGGGFGDLLYFYAQVEGLLIKYSLSTRETNTIEMSSIKSDLMKNQYKKIKFGCKKIVNETKKVKLEDLIEVV